ncbi:MAG: ferrous iron transporter B [Hyphomicrobiales bacterium]
MTTASETSAWRFALVGTPNSGKTALFNALTGSRQKVANYPGVTVERKAGIIQTPGGHRVDLIDLPGTYSLRGRSPDEEITRDIVLGRLASEAAPDLLLCVADATNLRVALRLVIELKQVGRPLMLVLNMIDIARRRGIDIDLVKLSKELGAPVVTSAAVRRGGTEDLMRRIDAMAAGASEASVPNTWKPPTTSDLRAAQREADRIIRVAVSAAARPETLTGRVDAVLLHPVAGLLILLGLLFVLFQAVFTGAKPLMDFISIGFDALGAMAHDAMPAGLLQSFIQNGVISGVGSVVVFLPQILILFLFILLLEDLGYMARAAFLMDRIMGGAGLHGRAFIPLLSSFACAIPGIMATRVIDNRRDRLTTILVAPLMTCSARIPVYTLIISAFIPDKQIWGWVGLQGLVMFGLYAAGIFSALAVSFVANRFFWRENATPPFMIELPDYKMPRLPNVAMGLYMRAMMFLKRAGTTIFSMMVLIWFLASFPRPPAGAVEPAINFSLASIIGRWIEPILAPVGFNWQISVALIPGMAAREVAVASLGTVYAIEGGKDVAAQIGQTLAGQWSLATALALLVWYIFAPQCASTLAVIKRETGSWRWMFITFGYMLALAYTAAFITYNVAVALGAG